MVESETENILSIQVRFKNIGKYFITQSKKGKLEFAIVGI